MDNKIDKKKESKLPKNSLTKEEIFKANEGQFRNKDIARKAGIKSGEVRKVNRKISDYMQKLLDKTTIYDEVEGSNAEHIAAVYVKKALSGDVTALRDYVDRLEGKATIKAEVNTTITMADLLDADNE